MDGPLVIMDGLLATTVSMASVGPLAILVAMVGLLAIMVVMVTAGLLVDTGTAIERGYQKSNCSLQTKNSPLLGDNGLFF